MGRSDLGEADLRALQGAALLVTCRKGCHRWWHLFHFSGGRAMLRLAFLVLGCSALAALAQAQPGDSRDWATYRNDRYGLFLRYPADILQPERTSEAGDGQVFVSRDGEARLLVGALANSDRQSPAAYQEQIARGSYAGYQVTLTEGSAAIGSHCRVRATA